MLDVNRAVWGNRDAVVFSLPPGIEVDEDISAIRFDISQGVVAQPQGAITSDAWRVAEEAIKQAGEVADVGATVPPMHTVKGVRRIVAQWMVSAFLRLAQVITRDQRRFNRAQINASQSLTQMVEMLDRRLTDVSNELSRLEMSTLSAMGDTGRKIDTLWDHLGTLTRNDDQIFQQLGTITTRHEELNFNVEQVQQHVSSLATEYPRLVEQLRVEMELRWKELSPRQTTDPEDDFGLWAASLKEVEQRAGVWVNPPLSLAYSAANGVEVEWINERLVEQPKMVSELLLRAQPRQTIVDFGGTESLVPLQLAALGFKVTMVDIRPSAFKHPNLTQVIADLRKLPFPDSAFDHAYALSTLEHVGVGHYGDEIDPNGDAKCVREAWRVLRDGGYFLLSSPVGIPDQNELQRIYAPSDLVKLVADRFQIETTYIYKSEKLGEVQFWMPVTENDVQYVDSSRRVQAVMMIVARKECAS